MSSVVSTPPERTGADPRPELIEHEGQLLVAGSRCGDCAYPMAVMPPRCPVCGSTTMAPAAFGPGGTVFSSTVLCIPVPGRNPPFTLAYVDLDEGPRILAHVEGSDEVLIPQSRTVIAGWTQLGDPVVRAYRGQRSGR